jgi:hypothetical protein
LAEKTLQMILKQVWVLKTQAEQMKVQFGSALSNEAKGNAFVTIPVCGECLQKK